jgi:hypothetical protein
MQTKIRGKFTLDKTDKFECHKIADDTYTLTAVDGRKMPIHLVFNEVQKVQLLNSITSAEMFYNNKKFKAAAEKVETMFNVKWTPPTFTGYDDAAEGK